MLLNHACLTIWRNMVLLIQLTVHGGNVFGSLEGTLLRSGRKTKADVDATNVAVYSIAKFFEHEKDFYQKFEEYEDAIERELLEPDDEHSTELGKISHEPRKGTINTYPGSTAAYGMVGYYYQ